MLVVPLALIGWAAKMYSGNLENSAQAKLERTMASRLLADVTSSDNLSQKFTDADGDLLADPPKDEKDLLDPETINFSYVASSDSEDEEATWKEFIAALSEKLGKPVNLVEVPVAWHLDDFPHFEYVWSKAGVLPGYRESIFFSLENYTSLGLTRVNVPDHWRMLAPMMAGEASM